MFALNLSLLGHNTDVHFRVPRDKRKKICQHLGGKPLNFAGLPNHVRVSINHGKTCTECGSFEDGTPEFILVLNRINDLEKAVETSLKGHITVRCTKCDKDTRHTCKSENLYSFQKHWHCALHDLNYLMALQEKILQKSNYHLN